MIFANVICNVPLPGGLLMEPIRHWTTDKGFVLLTTSNTMVWGLSF